MLKEQKKKQTNGKQDHSDCFNYFQGMGQVPNQDKGMTKEKNETRVQKENEISSIMTEKLQSINRQMN